MARKGELNPNAGRREGQTTRLSRRLADELATSALAPLQVMIDNMTFWHEHSKDLATRAAEALDNLSSDASATPAEKIELTKGANELLKNFVNARDRAQSCAVDAAPYLHPRLQSIVLKKDTKEEIIIEADLAAPIPGKIEDRSYRDNYNVTPIIKKSA